MIARQARTRIAPEAPPPVAVPRAFPDLASRGLVGISNRAIADHVRLYERAVAELGGIEEELRLSPWAPPAEMASNEIQAILDSPVSSLMQPYGPDGSVMQPDGKLAECLAEVVDELRMKGISWVPDFYMGDGDFWTADRATSINIPWYLATDGLWSVVNDRLYRYTAADVVATLRHEIGHAVGYAFELWRRPEWEAAFGDFRAPYDEVYSVDADSRDFVDYLSRTGSASIDHYGQKHPDEDWAETFAEWLDPGSRWREAYADRPAALAKLEAVELMIVGRGAAYGVPPNAHRGKRVPASKIEYTVASFLGVGDPGAPDARAALLRRAPAVRASVALHELYFEQLRRGAGASVGAGLRLREAAASSFGSFDGWLADARAICAATDGWMVASWAPRAGRVRNSLVEGHDRGLPAGERILLAIDCHEHAYFDDYGARKDLGIAAFFRNLDWAVVDIRFAEANLPPAIPVPAMEPPAMPETAVVVSPVPAIDPPPLPPLGYAGT